MERIQIAPGHTFPNGFTVVLTADRAGDTVILASRNGSDRPEYVTAMVYEPSDGQSWSNGHYFDDWNPAADDLILRSGRS